MKYYPVYRSKGAAASPWGRTRERPFRRRVKRSIDPDWERERQTERARLARSLDIELQVACRTEAAARRELGCAAHELLACRGYQRLCFVRVGDYARERLGVSARTLQSAAWVAARLDALPLIGTAFDRSEISWTQARALCALARGDDEAEWLRRARTCSAEELEVAAKAIDRDGAPHPDPDADDGSIDDEPAARLRIACPARVRALWRHALELASRVAGQSLVPWRSAEIIAAEAFSGRPPGISFGDRALLVAMRLARRARRIGTRATASSAPDDRASAPLQIRARSDTAVLAARVPCDPFALDARLRFAMGTIRTTEPRIGRLLRVIVDHKLYRTLAFPKVDAYVRERLGISPRKAWALLKIERTVRRTVAFARSYEDGALPWARALTLLPVVDRENEDAWIARAATVTARRLTDEVNWTLERRDILGSHVALDPPALDSDLASPVAQALADECRKSSPSPALQNGAPVYEVCDAEIQFTAPASVVALVRDTMDAFEHPGEPRWTAFERMLRHVITYWTEIGRHRDPVFARDGWRCAVPACSSRCSLHDHHIQYRSRGGGNERWNRLTICAAHHLHGIHRGAMRTWGTAPRPVYWQLGVRAGRPPLLSYVGDRVWDADVCSDDRSAAAGAT